MKIILILLFLFIPHYLASANMPNKVESPKSMKVFVEIDGKFYEVIIDKKGVPRPKELAHSTVQKKFRDEAKRFGIAYLQDKIFLAKETDKTGP